MMALSPKSLIVGGGKVSFHNTSVAILASRYFQFPRAVTGWLPATLGTTSMGNSLLLTLLSFTLSWTRLIRKLGVWMCLGHVYKLWKMHKWKTIKKGFLDILERGCTGTQQHLCSSFILDPNLDWPNACVFQHKDWGCGSWGLVPSPQAAMGPCHRGAFSQQTSKLDSSQLNWQMVFYTETLELWQEDNRCLI